MWCLLFLTDGNDTQIRVVLDLEVTDHIVNAMRHENIQIRTPALRTAGNILTADHQVADVMIDSGVIPVLADLLNDPSSAIRQEVCWAFSNILAGSQLSISTGFLPMRIVRLFIDFLHIVNTDTAEVSIYELPYHNIWCLGRI